MTEVSEQPKVIHRSTGHPPIHQPPIHRSSTDPPVIHTHSPPLARAFSYQAARFRWWLRASFVKYWLMQNYKRLRVTRTAREVIRATYHFTRTLPKDEVYVLNSQMRRSAISVGLNLAEGCSRSSTRELIRFIQVAAGSAMELDVALLVTEDLGMGMAQRRVEVIDHLRILQRELFALIRALRLRQLAGTRS